MIDKLLAHIEKTKSLTKTFTQVEQDTGKSQFKLIGEHASLFVGIQDILFSADHYITGKPISINEEAEKFLSLLTCITEQLQPSDVRRIGIVCEYRSKSKTELPSRELLNEITKISSDGFPAKFQLQFERRHPITTTTGIPDIRTDDFWNVIESFYDSENDVDHSLPKHINLLIDIQRYYKPLLKDRFDSAVRGVVERYQSEAQKIFEKSYVQGLMNGN